MARSSRRRKYYKKRTKKRSFKKRYTKKMYTKKRNSKKRKYRRKKQLGGRPSWLARISGYTGGPSCSTRSGSMSNEIAGITAEGGCINGDGTDAYRALDCKWNACATKNHPSGSGYTQGVCTESTDSTNDWNFDRCGGDIKWVSRSNLNA